jgi:hypothetical protein
VDKVQIEIENKKNIPKHSSVFIEIMSSRQQSESEKNGEKKVPKHEDFI